MGWPESVTYLLLVVLGYALKRVVDLACDWQQQRLRRPAGSTEGADSLLFATARQSLIERQAVYARFRKSVTNAVDSSVNQGHGTYGSLYQIRDDYGDLLRVAPPTITQAADSIIRCVTLLVNLGPSDQRYAMFTRALKNFDDECGANPAPAALPPGPQKQEFAVLGGSSEIGNASPAPGTGNTVS